MRITERLPRETGRDYALRILKNNIISLELAPGSMVSENELSAEMGLSRTPVREALIELSKVKIVEIFPQRGSGVALIDFALVEESLFMRQVLECAVAQLCCEVATPEDVTQLKESVKLQDFYVQTGGTTTQILDLDNSFHRMLFEIAGKPQVFSMMRNIAIHFDRVRNITLSTVQAQTVVKDHNAIVDAIAHHDAPDALACMERHLNRYRVAEPSVHSKFPEYFK